MNKRKLGAALLALLLAVTLIFAEGPAAADAASSGEIKKQINELEEQNKELQAQIDELRGQFEATENEIVDMVNQKNLIDQEIALLHTQINLINDQITVYSLLIADKQDELDAAQARLHDLNEKNKARIRAMEEEGNLSYWSIVFEANSFSDLLDRLNMVQEIAAADRQRIRELAEAAEAVSIAQEVLETEKLGMEDVKAELDVANATLAQRRADADALITELIARGEEFELLLEESEALQDELMAEIAVKEAEYKDAKYQEWLATSVPTTEPSGSGNTDSGNAPPSSSGWVTPVPSYTLTSPFGMRMHPILGYPRMHNGVDMACAQGTPIYAARSGKVTVASYQDGGAGNYVSINHGDGYASIYMHMTNYIVSVGQYVSAGQVIGYVGNTGLSKGFHLHFGISYNGTYVNPMNYVG